LGLDSKPTGPNADPEATLTHYLGRFFSYLPDHVSGKIMGVRNNSPTVQTRSVSPAAIAGVCIRYRPFNPGTGILSEE